MSTHQRTLALVVWDLGYALVLSTLCSRSTTYYSQTLLIVPRVSTALCNAPEQAVYTRLHAPQPMPYSRLAQPVNLISCIFCIMSSDDSMLVLVLVILAIFARLWGFTTFFLLYIVETAYVYVYVYVYVIYLLQCVMPVKHVFVLRLPNCRYRSLMMMMTMAVVMSVCVSVLSVCTCAYPELETHKQMMLKTLPSRIHGL